MGEVRSACLPWKGAQARPGMSACAPEHVASGRGRKRARWRSSSCQSWRQRWWCCRRGLQRAGCSLCIWGLTQRRPALGRHLLNFPPTSATLVLPSTRGQCWEALALGSAGHRRRSSAGAALERRWGCPQAPCPRCMCSICAGQHWSVGNLAELCPVLGGAGLDPRCGQFAEGMTAAPCMAAGAGVAGGQLAAPWLRCRGF